MANRAQENYKLIVGIEGSRSGDIPSHKQKDKIPGRRGIVYFNADGSSSSTTGNPPSEDEDGNKTDGTTQPDDGSGSSNGGNTTGDAGITDPYPIDDATENGSGIYDVDNLTLGDVVKGVSGLVDCATGDPVDVRFDGQFTAPEGWDDPSAPPEDPEYEAGYYWVSGEGFYAAKFATPMGVVRSEETIPAGFDEWDGDWYLHHKSPADYWYDGISWYRRKYKINGSSETLEASIHAYKVSCGSSIESYCNPTPDDILLTEWPSDKPMQLSYNAETGKYETNPYDSNVTTAYAQPVSSFSLCNSNGETIKSFPQANGGQALMNQTTGVATFIDANGKVTGYGDGAAVTNGQPR